MVVDVDVDDNEMGMAVTTKWCRVADDAMGCVPSFFCWYCLVGLDSSSLLAWCLEEGGKDAAALSFLSLSLSLTAKQINKEGTKINNTKSIEGLQSHHSSSETGGSTAGIFQYD